MPTPPTAAESTAESTVYPARYLVQRLEGLRWVKVGNGANHPHALYVRKMRLQMTHGGTYRVYDRINGVEVSPA